MATAGDMILAGDLGRAIKAYRAAGSSAAGWRAAERTLRERHPESSQASIDAVVRHAQATVQTAGRYARAGPNYAIPAGDVPDVRYLQPRPPTAPGEAPGAPRQSFFHHQAIVEIRDPALANRVVNRFVVEIRSEGILTKEEYERRAGEAAQSYVKTFVQYDTKHLPIRRLDYSFSLEGVYRGF